MQCPTCKIDMKVQLQYITENPTTGRKYDRIVYLCQTDDVWASFEMPREEDGNVKEEMLVCRLVQQKSRPAPMLRSLLQCSGAH